MPNVMAALPNIGGASVQCRKVWLTPTTRVPCSNATKTGNPLKFAGVPQTNETISAASGPTFTILPGHVEEILPDKVVGWCQMATFWRFFCSRAQHVSDLHSKFTLRPHHVWKYGTHPISDR